MMGGQEAAELTVSQQQSKMVQIQKLPNISHYPARELNSVISQSDNRDQSSNLLTIWADCSTRRPAKTDATIETAMAVIQPHSLAGASPAASIKTKPKQIIRRNII